MLLLSESIKLAVCSGNYGSEAQTFQLFHVEVESLEAADFFEQLLRRISEHVILIIGYFTSWLQHQGIHMIMNAYFSQAINKHMLKISMNSIKQFIALA